MHSLMSNAKRPWIIGVDCDGVLLDYNRGYGAMWEQYFGVTLSENEPLAYHATHFWGLEALAKDHGFWDHFDQHGWSNMPAMPGAVEACQRLAAAGHTLVCITSMPAHRAEMRLANLKALDFPIEQVIATGSHADRTANPKREAIEILKPDWFVDDELLKLKDLGRVRCVLIDPGHPDSPNEGQDNSFLEVSVSSLSAFADFLLGPVNDTYSKLRIRAP